MYITDHFDLATVYHPSMKFNITPITPEKVKRLMEVDSVVYVIENPLTLEQMKRVFGFSLSDTVTSSSKVNYEVGDAVILINTSRYKHEAPHGLQMIQIDADMSLLTVRNIFK